MTRRLLDWIIPPQALRWDQLHPMTTDPAPLVFLWEQQFYRQHPVLDPSSFIDGGSISKGTAVRLTADDFPLIKLGPFTDENRDAWRAAFFEGLDTPPEAFREDRP